MKVYICVANKDTSKQLCQWIQKNINEICRSFEMKFLKAKTTNDKKKLKQLGVIVYPTLLDTYGEQYVGISSIQQYLSKGLNTSQLLGSSISGSHIRDTSGIDVSPGYEITDDDVIDNWRQTQFGTSLSTQGPKKKQSNRKLTGHDMLLMKENDDAPNDMDAYYDKERLKYNKNIPKHRRDPNAESDDDTDDEPAPTRSGRTHGSQHHKTREPSPGYDSYEPTVKRTLQGTNDIFYKHLVDNLLPT